MTGLLIALLARGHVLLEGVPGVAKTLLVRSFSARARPRHEAHPVHARPHAGRRVGVARLRREGRRVRVPRGSGLHERRARRRDQPHAAQDAVGAARGDGGAPGLDRRRDPAAARPVPRRRDAEPDRARGHLHAARGAARPVPAEAHRRRPGARGRARRAPAPRRAASTRATSPRAGLRTGGHRRRDPRGAAGRGIRHRRRRRPRLRRRPRPGHPAQPVGAARRQPPRLDRPAGRGEGVGVARRVPRHHARPRADDAACRPGATASGCAPTPSSRASRSTPCSARSLQQTRVPI